MAKRRLTVLAAVLMVVSAVALYVQYTRYLGDGSLTSNRAPTLIIPQVVIDRVTVEPDAQRRWWATVNYRVVNGKPGAMVFAEAMLSKEQVASFALAPVALRPEESTVRLQVIRPDNGSVDRFTTDRVQVLASYGGKPVARADAERRIDWPSYDEWLLDREMASRTADESLVRAISLIDDGGDANLNRAKQILERLIAADAALVQAYIELARVAMKTRWGPEGLQQAERLLDTALKLQPDSVNAKILLGYVYVHQGRPTKGQTLFKEVAPIDPPNLWLWVNWGESYERLGQVAVALQHYRRALSVPPTRDTYDNARLWAFDRAIRLLGDQGDLDATEALYKQRAREYPGRRCMAPDHAAFLLWHRGSAESAREVLTAASSEPCLPADVKVVSSAVLYHRWASLTGPEAATALAQARVAGAAGPRVLLMLARSERTAPTIRRLLQDGERIDQADNAGMTALAYAVQERQARAARRLVALGANPQAPVGAGDVPLALWPVLERDLDGVKLMKSLGVDYKRLRWQGSTAIDHAKQTGDRQLLDLLQGAAESS